MLPTVLRMRASTRSVSLCARLMKESCRPMSTCISNVHNPARTSIGTRVTSVAGAHRSVSARLLDVNAAPQRRSFATDPSSGGPSKPAPPTSAAAASSTLSKTLAFATSRTGMITIGGTAFAVVIGRIAYDIAHAFVHLDFYTVAEVGFVAGFATATSGFGFFTYFNRIRSIDVEAVMADALDMVQRSPKVAEAMGLSGFTFSSVQTGTIRTYQIEGGHFTTSRSSGFPTWKKPKVQVMFQVWGGSNEKQGIVVAEAFTDLKAQRRFTFVSFDLLEGKSGFQGNNPTVIVHGDESLLKVRNDMRSFVTLNRVYVRSLE